MKALSLWQPWASLIAIGEKTIETRSWRAPKSLIGQRIAVHAAKRPIDDVGIELLDLVDPRAEATWRRDGLPLGAVVATARLVACVPMYHVAQLIGGTAGALWPNVQLNGIDCATLVHPDADGIDSRRVDDQIPFGDFRPGRWAWLLEDVERLDPPVPATGRQGVWRWQP